MKHGVDELLDLYGLYDEEELAEYIRQSENQDDEIVKELLVIMGESV